MSENQPYAVALSQEEVLLITLKTRLPLMFGLTKEMLEVPNEDLQAILESAEKTLLARDYLRKSPDGNMRLAPVVMAAVFTCSKPERTMLATRNSPGQPPETLMVHQSLEMVVDHSLSRSGEHIFTILPSDKLAIDAMLKLSRAGNYTKSVSPAGSMPESVYIEANKLSQEENPGQVNYLLKQHLPELTADSLHLVLNNFEASVTVARLLTGEKPEDRRQDGFTLLQGGSVQWLLRSNGTAPERTISLEPVEIKDVRREIKKLMRGK